MPLGSQRKVLVVEDDEGMREAIESLLDAAGIASVSYASAEALLDSGDVGGAACVITDLMLQGMSGLQLLDTLNHRGPHPPVILITAHDSPAVRSEAASHGAAAYLAKPFLGSALLAAIGAAV